MTTYKKLTWDSYKIQVESAVRDGNGATISTTYATKTELSTGLGNKLDTTTAASTYLSKTDASNTYAPLTKLTDGSVTKVGTANVGTDTKPIKLVSGVPTAVANDLVDVSSAQNVTGLKIFKGIPVGPEVIISNNAAYVSGQQWSGAIDFNTDNGNKLTGRILARKDGANASYGCLQIYDTGTGDYRGELGVGYTGSETYGSANYRTYDSGNVNDIVTIGSLAANPNVVHTIGAETIYGGKIFRDATYFGIHDGCLYTENLGNGPSFVLSMPNGNNAAYLTLNMNNDGNVYLNVVKKAGGTFTSTTIATL